MRIVSLFSAVLGFLLAVDALHTDKDNFGIRELEDAHPKPRPKPHPESSSSSTGRSSSASSSSSAASSSTSAVSATASDSSTRSTAAPLAVGFVALAGLAGAAAFRSRREVTITTHALEGSVAKRMERMDKFVRPDLDSNYVGMQDDASAQV